MNLLQSIFTCLAFFILGINFILLYAYECNKDNIEMFFQTNGFGIFLILIAFKILIHIKQRYYNRINEIKNI